VAAFDVQLLYEVHQYPSFAAVVGPDHMFWMVILPPISPSSFLKCYAISNRFQTRP
jgi:hypothetical protein